jgi:hypothetical protein
VKTIFLDYSGSHNSGRENGGPPEQERGKFIQLRNGGVEYLVFSPTGVTPYHADIVGRFCRDRNIAGVYDTGKKRFDIHDRAWTIAGGGKYEMDRLHKCIRLYDNSMAYGRFDSRGLRARILKVEALKDYAILIE